MRRLIMLLIVLVAAPVQAANVFSMPSGQKSLEFVSVGDAGNVADSRYVGATGLTFGGVNYAYQIGKYDVTLSQYSQFLNAVAAADPYGVYDSGMFGGVNIPGIQRFGASGSYSYTANSGFENYPVFRISWNSAARFVNWLDHGQPTGPAGPSTTESGAYTLITSGPFTINGDTVARSAGATYWIPSEDEWYKAAYYKGAGLNAGYWTYATQSDTAPSNTLSPTGTNNANYTIVSSTDPVYGNTSVGAFAASPSEYGTFDQSGNIDNHTEGMFSGSRIYRGGDFQSPAAGISSAFRGGQIANAASGGFRVATIAAVPEPSSIVLLIGSLFGMIVWALRRRPSLR